MSSHVNTNDSSIETRRTYCRVCQAHCAMEVDVQDGKPIAVRGDRNDPVYKGYTCIKGRQMVEEYYHPERIKKPLKKMPDGSFEEISFEQAYEEITAIVKKHIDNDGPRSIASYIGTFGHMSQPSGTIARGFHNGLKSDSYYTTASIDQIDKFLARSRFGEWGGGVKGFSECDTLLMVGINPPIAHSGSIPGGVPVPNPAGHLNSFVKNGGTVICIDPRRTESAKKAQYHLQIRPGEDPTLLIGMIRIVLEEGLHDKEFCEQYFEGLDEFRAAIDDFTPEYVSLRTGVDRELIEQATRAFAAGKAGNVSTGTGPDFALHGVLTEHLALVLGAILGRYTREGEKAAYVKSLFPEPPRKAQVQFPPQKLFGVGPKSRVRGLGQIMGEMPTTALPDEILEPGEGQIKVLFNVGGNPLAAWSDQYKTRKALESLELLVSVDIRMAETCKISDYILPAKMCLEREDVTMAGDFLSFYEQPYAHYTKAVVEPNGEPFDPWELYWELAKRLGYDIELFGNNLPMDEKPSIFEAIKFVYDSGRASIAELREHDGGKMFPEFNEVVLPPDPDNTAKFQPAAEGVIDEIREIRGEALTEDGRRVDDKDYEFLLVSRRLKNTHNSNGRGHEVIRKRGTTNCAYMNPADLENFGLKSGDLIRISGKYGEIVGVAEGTDEIRNGVISMSHGWGDWYGQEEGDVRETGVSTTRLVATDKEYCPIHGKGRMSAIPVNVSAA